jgi:hypothetical protein
MQSLTLNSTKSTGTNGTTEGGNLPFFSPSNCKIKIAALLVGAIIAAFIGRSISSLFDGMNKLLVGFSLTLFIIVAVWYIIDTYGDFLFMDTPYLSTNPKIEQYKKKDFPMKPQ